jgi:uncharacterized membrane protein YkvA (DUF1232 family)
MRGLLSILFNLPKYMRLSWRLMKDRQVPWHSKLIVILVGLYVLSPIDLIPEFVIPHLGFGDDLLFFLLAIQHLIRSSPKEIASHHANEIAKQKNHRPAP